MAAFTFNLLCASNYIYWQVHIFEFDLDDALSTRLNLSMRTTLTLALTKITLRCRNRNRIRCRNTTAA